MLISTWSDKGGTGKTTIAIVIAEFFGAQILDLDPQGDIDRWADRAGRRCLKLSASKSADTTATLIQAAEAPTLTVVDCPPGHDTAALQGMAFSQLVVVPTRSGDADLIALARALEAVKLVRANGNPDLRIGVVLNAIRETGRARGISQALKVASGYDYLGEIKERLAYEESYSTGTTVLAQPGPASQEVRSIMNRIQTILAIEPSKASTAAA